MQKIYLKIKPKYSNPTFLGDKKGAKVAKLTKNEVLMVNIGSLSTGGRVIAVKADLAKIGLTAPVCTEVGEKIALSRRLVPYFVASPL